MKNYLIIIFIFCISCKKNSDPLDKFSNNDIELKVFSSTGDSSLYSFHGTNAPMYKTTGIYSNNKFVAEGKINASERKVIFGVDSYDTTNTKVTCVYFPDGTNSNSYSTEYLPDPGIITFTTFTNNFAEGTFNAKCKMMSDSILIKGTFRGYYNN